MTTHQASCVLVNGCAVLIEGEPGSGKSSLALALIDRGAALIGDDGVALSVREGRLWANPPPNTAGLLEIRNVGIVEMAAQNGPVGLIIRLDRAAPRYVEEAQHCTLSSVQVPVITLFPDTPALPLRTEWAVRKHGIAS